MSDARRFVVQLHDATRLHADFRLQDGDVLRSWAVPKGPSMDPAHRRLAVPVPDHSLQAGDFEGVYPGGRGSGAVIVWDEGTFVLKRGSLTGDHVVVDLRGHKLRGCFAITRTGPKQAILLKMKDTHARPGSDILAEAPESVRSGRTWQEVAGLSPG